MSATMPIPEATSPKPSSILKQHDAQECAPPSPYFGLNYAMSPRSTPKSVSIAPQTEVISPLILGNQKNVDEFDLEDTRTSRKPPIKSGSKRLTGRPATIPSPSLKPLTPIYDGTMTTDDKEHAKGPYSRTQVDALIDQVSNWIREERAKRAKRKPKKAELPAPEPRTEVESSRGVPNRDVDFDDEPDLDKLEDILKQNLNLERLPCRRPSAGLRRRSSIRKLQRKPSSVSSDTDYFDGGDTFVPSCDVVLDNSKTLAYNGGASDESDASSGDELSRVASYRNQNAWTRFKFEIVRLAHTLHLKGWRKVPMDMSGAISVERLSGALTNAVYVVSPPDDLPPRLVEGGTNGTVARPRKTPPKLLLRIYGPQVEHLIDRESELAILRRLAKNRIGPRLLGTFANGRFEEFFYAKTLTPEDMRNPDMSRHIAKRMRELHDGIELLEKERDDGAFVWRNWDKWVQRVEQIVTWLDDQVRSLEPGAKLTGSDSWKRRGLICGVPWKRFRETVEMYRAWLEAQYGGSQRIRERLVFAHNDTQYGNILRLEIAGESPLLLPANAHKQLVVIDFEYASANVPGLEFANHFTEWCYNYHDKRKPYVCNTDRYPSPDEQDRFIRAYVRHRPQFNVSTPRMAPDSPSMGPAMLSEQRRSTSNISDFILDARGQQNPASTALPAASNDQNEERATEDAEVTRLAHETRLWRLANTAQWVAWGIVQAKVPGMPTFTEPASQTADAMEDAAREDLGERADQYRQLAEEKEEEQTAAPQDEQEEEFDYLGYAQHRAMFFWGDAIQLGLAKAEELPEELRAKVKTVPY